MPSYRELLAATKAEIREVDTATADELRHDARAVVLDVREPDEYEQGAIPGAVHIPRGNLESGIESRVRDKSTPLVVHCAGGNRSAFAAQTLTQLGYTDVVSVAGGFNKWKDEGRDWVTPRNLTADQRNRYQRHLLLPEVGVAGVRVSSVRATLPKSGLMPAWHCYPCAGHPTTLERAISCQSRTLSLNSYLESSQLIFRSRWGEMRDSAPG
jgi:rhodanese-related sulfurtransferase